MNAEELLDFGLTYQFKGQLEKAEDYLKKALAQNPKLKGAHLGLGDIYIKKNNVDAAEKMYIKEIEINPASVKAHIELANVYIIKGEEGRALPNFEKALSLSPNDWRASKGIGYIYFMKGELSKAVGWLRMAVNENEEDLAIHFWLTLVHHQNKFITEMDKEIERVKDICRNMEKFITKPKDVVSYILGKTAALQGKHKEAIKYLEDLRKKVKIKSRKRFELGLFFDELDILKTLVEVYTKTGNKIQSNTIQKEIEGLTQVELQN